MRRPKKTVSKSSKRCITIKQLLEMNERGEWLLTPKELELFKRMDPTTEVYL